MRAIGKGLLVIFMTIGLAHADTERELQKLLRGKTTVYQGTCHLNEQGMFRDKEEKYTVHRCIVGADMNEEGEIYYALIYDGSKPVKLIRINKDAKPVAQDVLWAAGSTT